MELQMSRPYVLLSCAMSVDGRIDDAGPRRLVLSNEEDLDRVDAERARSDAILVGAGTVRRDDPRLLVRSTARREERARRGLPPNPARVIVASRDLDPAARVFAGDDGVRLVYCPTAAVERLAERLGASASVVDAGDPLRLDAVLDDLAGRGVGRLMVEGGSTIHTSFLAAGLADELQLVVAPILVGDARAPRFVRDVDLPHDAGQRMVLAEARRIGDVVLLRYLLTTRARDHERLMAAIELSERCPPSETAFSVGAVIVDAGGRVMAEGHSREADPHVHAEESALAKVAPGDPRLASATIYSSLEPCSRRRSRPHSCTWQILAAGIGRVVFAMREPDLFVDCRGAEELVAAGVTVIEMPDLAGEVRRVNRHLLSG
jgi:riboflavin-specific deaminase-like protein